MLGRLFGKDKQREAAREVYRDIIVQARKPVFYDDLTVPDTVEGRFDMITLHMFLVLRRLKADETQTAAFSQKLFDVMFKNMDDSLREMGVGDLTVGKKVRKLAEDFYGRINAYEKAMAAEEDGAPQTTMVAALLRNIFGRSDDDSDAARSASAIARYALEADGALSQQKTDRLMLGFVSFPEPENAIA